MGLNFGDVSDEDIERQRMIQNPPSHEPGYGGEQPVSTGGLDFDSFDDSDSGFDSGFGSDDNSPFGGFSSSPGGNPFGGSSFGSSGGGSPFGGSPFGGSPFGDSGGGNPFGAGYGSMSATTQQTEANNGAADFFLSLGKDLGSFLLDIVGSFKNRNVDDWAELSSMWLTIGGIMSVCGVVSTVVGTFGDISALKLGGLGGTGVFGGLMVLASGFTGLGINTYLKAKGGEYARTGGQLKDVQRVEQPQEVKELDDSLFDFSGGEEEDNSTNDMSTDSVASGSDDNSLASLMATVFGEDSDGTLDFPVQDEVDETEEEEEPEEVDYKKLQTSIREDTPYINRSMLFDTFKDFFPLCSLGFTDIKEYDLGDEEVMKIGTKLNAALAILLPDKDPEIREVQIESLRETHFAFEVCFSRLKVKTLKIEALADEMVTQFKKNAKDDSISITIDTIGSTNIALITKGETKPVTIGDCLRKKEVEDYIKNSKNKLPFIAGINELGEVRMADMKNYLSLIITGKPRSGKSWYVNSILSTLVAFNKPEDIQFIVVDPKKTSLFKAFSLLPHVCGLHDGTNILDLFREVMNSEAERRKKLFADAAVDNIWEFKKSQPEVKLPVLMFVIDEIVTIYNDLKEKKQDKEFTSYIQKIFTQLPYLGIGLMLIPHRTTGILDKMVRMNVSYKVAVMADNESIEEEVGAKRWRRPLVSPGDMAVKASDWKSAEYLKGTGVALEDEDVRILLKEIAKAWYKIGVEQPDMTYLGECVTRDEDEIKDLLHIESSNRIQYSTLDLD